MMPNYIVEEVDRDFVKSSVVVDASTPMLAAIKATGRTIALRKAEQSPWIKVTGSGKQPFEFAIAD
jgi:hypothetical protein